MMSAMSRKSRTITFFGLFYTIVFFALSRTALTQQNADSSTATGMSPLATYRMGDIDKVNPVNGNVYLDIPLLSYPQLGHSLSLAFRIYSNDKQWTLKTSGYTQNQNGLPTGVWALSTGNGPGVYVARDQHLDFGYDIVSPPPATGSSGYSAWQVQSQIFWNYVVSADGAKHYYSDTQYQTGSGPYPGTLNSNIGSSYPSVDGAGYKETNRGSNVIVDGNGVTYSLGNGNPILETVQDPTALNKITATTSGWTDTISRNIPGSLTSSASIDPSFLVNGQFTPMEPTPGVPVNLASANCPSGATAARSWVVPGVGGASRNFALCYKPFNFGTHFNVNTFFTGYPYTWNCYEASGQATLLFAIVLPNNTSYAFDYDEFLSLKSITLPTGATIAYTWQTLAFSNTNYGTPVSRALLSRTVTPGNGQPSRVWQYHWSTVSNSNTYVAPPDGSTVWSVISDPSGNDEEHQIQNGYATGPLEVGVNNYQGCGPHNPSCGGSSTPLKSVTYSSFASGGPADNDMAGISGIQPVLHPPMIPLTTTTTLYQSTGSTQVSQETRTLTPLHDTCNVYHGFGVGGQNGTLSPTPTTPCFATNQTASDAVYDFGSSTPGSLLRTTNTRYQWQDYSNYLAANLLNFPETVTVTAGTPTDSLLPAAGTPMTQTVYTYDGSQGGTNPPGNLTSVTRGLSGQSTTSTTTAYNTIGMPTDTYDGRSNKTHYDYDNSGLYVSTITYPSTSGNTHVESSLFDVSTGLITSHTDQNSEQTLSSYIDPRTSTTDVMNRLHKITLPATVDGSTAGTGSGNITYTYVDTPGSLSVEVDTLQSTSGLNTASSTTYFDNLGETTQTKAVTSPGDPILVDTAYDLGGRVQSVSNPYSGSPNPGQVTSYAYDGLGRRVLQTNTDSSTQQWAYSGSSTTFTDETSRNWVRTSDALGRLTAVTEFFASPSVIVTDNSGASAPVNCGIVCALVPATTSYVYDALDNLRKVNQPGLSGETARTPRTFQYDSLSRLSWSNNPESGFICYGQGDGTQSGCQANGYDGNGNLVAKTDARGVVASYFYDELNRLTSKTYSGANGNAPLIASSTPSSTYIYDAGVGTTVSNSKGRLVAEFTGPAGASISYRSILSYDAMGRVLGDLQCPISTAPCGAPIQYSYDLAGNMTSSTNGSSGTPLSFSYQYDAAGRLQNLTSSWSDSAHPATLFAPPSSGAKYQYGPLGLNGALLGVSGTSQTGIYSQQRTYDSRRRVTSESDSQTGAEPGTGNIQFVGGDGESYDVLSGGGPPPSQPPTCSYFVPNCGTIPDAGTLTVTLTPPGSSTVGFTASVDYDGEDDATLAAEVASALNQPDAQNNSPLVSATTVGSAVVLTSLITGTASNYAMNVSVTNQADYQYVVSGASLVGGTSGGAQGPFYTYGLTYLANNDIQSASDSVMGTWTYNYDTVNRLLAAQASANSQTNYAPYGSANLFWSYDSFGNFRGQTLSGTTQAAVNQGSYNYDLNNRNLSLNPDASGNAQTNGTATFTYDAEGRLASAMGVQYVYDAEGRRVAKLISASSGGGGLIGGDGSDSSSPPASAPTPTNLYLLGLGGDQISELSGSGSWMHTNVFQSGRLLATYDGGGLHFHFGDWLGTRRVQASGTGLIEESCQSLPFGDSLNCSGSFADATEHHFTGKERDTESVLDYFSTRYYASSSGRFMTPDDATDQHSSNPQSWNLYSYTRNNPVTYNDPDGHDVRICDYGTGQCYTATNPEYEAAQQSKNGGLYVPSIGVLSLNKDRSGNFTPTNITDSNGNLVGTATYISDGPADYYANRPGFDLLSNSAKGVSYASTPLVVALLLGLPGPLESAAPEVFLGIGGVGTAIGRAGLVPLDGKSRLAARETLEENGFKSKGTTQGGYETWQHPDGSKVTMGPDGVIDRIPPTSAGKGFRYDGSGNKVRPHTFPEEKVH